jgi:predicted amidohydrolase
MEQLRVGILQLEIIREDASRNAGYVLGQIRGAARSGCEVLVLPELWNVAFPLVGPQVLMTEHSPLVESIAKAACRNETWIIAGSMALSTERGPRNRCLVFSPDGEISCRYDKIHLYPGLDEPNILSPGFSPGCFDMDGLTCGVLTCFDVEFPELARSLSSKGSQILFVPAAWKTEYTRLWRALLISRAIENQVFVVGVNRCDRGKNSTFGGQSLVVDPFGDIILHLDDKPRFERVVLDLSRIESARSEHKVVSSMRPEIYRRWL